jgi:uroporphyrinogen decarboxylase
MTGESKKRVKNTLNREKCDRVPFNYLYNPGIDLQLKKHFKLNSSDNEGLRKALGVDIRGLGASYNGPRLHKEIPNRRVDPEWGYITRQVEHPMGDYWDYCDFPLKEASLEEVEKWPMPRTDDYDYDSLIPKAKEYDSYGLHLGNAGLACIMNTAGFFRSMDTMFMDLALDNEAGLLLIDRFLKVQLDIFERELEKVGHLVDFVWIGEDLGTQKGPIISLDMFRKHILPRQLPFLEMAKAWNLPVMIHTCGSSSWSYEDYLKAGVTAFDTLQPECLNMAPVYLMEHFGSRASFHGGISTTNELSFGTREEVENHVKYTLDIFMKNRGYFLSPAHCIQDNSPLENVLAMYETGEKYGRYQW